MLNDLKITNDELKEQITNLNIIINKLKQENNELIKGIEIIISETENNGN